MYGSLTIKGYSHCQLVTPSLTRNSYWNHEQKGVRAVVESVIGLAKGWEVVKAVFRGTASFQIQSLQCVYNLTAWRLVVEPIR